MITVDVSSFFAEAGGGGIRSYYEAKARWLTALGVECHFVVPGERAAIEQFAGGWLHRVAGPALSASYRAFGDVAELRRVIGALSPDVVELASHYVLPQLVAPACPRAAIVGFYHADFPTTYVAPAVSRLPRFAGQAALAAAWWLVRAQHHRYRATLAGSHAIAERLTRARVANVRWVGLGVDPALCELPLGGTTDAGRVGYLGRLSADKELSLVLAAAPAIERLTGRRVVIAGDGPARSAVRAAAARGVVDAVGAIDRASVAGFLRSLDALIVPGRYETFSLVAAEALAVGTPVVAARCGGAGELIERSGGGLAFAPGDPAALADAVRSLLDRRSVRRPVELDQLRTRARRYIADHHTWPRVVDRIRAVYDDAIRETRGARC